MRRHIGGGAAFAGPKARSDPYPFVRLPRQIRGTLESRDPWRSSHTWAGLEKKRGLCHVIGCCGYVRSAYGRLHRLT